MGRMQAVVVVGMPGSGKGLIAEIAREMGITVRRMGDAVWAETRRRGLPLTPENVGLVAQDARERWGRDVWAYRTMDGLESDVVLIDGIRSLDELDAFRSRWDLTVVAVHTSPSVRYDRMIRRGRADDPGSMDALVERDMRELSWGIGNVIALADIMLVNEGSYESFRERVKEVLSDIVGSWNDSGDEQST